MGLDAHSSPPSTSPIFESIVSTLKANQRALIKTAEQATNRASKLERSPLTSCGCSRVWGLEMSRVTALLRIQLVGRLLLHYLYDAITYATRSIVTLSISPTNVNSCPESSGAKGQCDGLAGHLARC
jgi:hypothetical protein